MNKKTELLAPCGSFEAFLAAVENGADAVYLGGERFSARQNAGNFSPENMKRALDYAHIRGVNVYLALNTLLYDEELKDALKMIEDAYIKGIDGVIVQDIGLAAHILNFFHDLPLHASTQMTVHNLDGVKVLEKLGFRRAVLARELSLKEIRYICQGTSLEIETFVHGALCVSYSGQCLMSSMIGGRSGNRGLCAQPCRLPYRLSADGKSIGKDYLLSPKDICTAGFIGEIIGSGVKSLKIEGRMKSPEYVASVVRVYRKYIDRYMEGQPSDLEEEDRHELLQVFNRGGFSKGYYYGKDNSGMMCFEKPKNWGVYLGDTISFNPQRGLVKLNLKETLSLGDGVEFWTGMGESPGNIVTRILKDNKDVRTASPGETVMIGSFKGGIRAGAKAYKTSSKELNNNLRVSFNGKYYRKTHISAFMRLKLNEPVSLTLTDDMGNEAKALSGVNPQRAQNNPTSDDRIREQLCKTGSTPYRIGGVKIEMDDGLVFPVSEINSLRRVALEELDKLRVNKYERKLMENFEPSDNKSANFPGNSRKNTGRPGLSAFFYKFPSNLKPEDIKGLRRIYLPLKDWKDFYGRKEVFRRQGTEIYLYTGIIFKDFNNRLPEMLEDIDGGDCDGLLIGSLGTIRQTENKKGLALAADYSFNVLNSSSLEALQKIGFKSVTLSLELDAGRIKDLENMEGIQKELTVYGEIPLMTTEYCPAACKSKCRKNTQGESVTLADRLGEEFKAVRDCSSCLTTIFNSRKLFYHENIKKLSLYGIDLIRLNFMDEDAALTRAVISLYNKLLTEEVLSEADNQLIKEIKDGGFTKGHLLKGVH